MIHNTTIKNLMKSSDSITSTHLVISEWNMNKYQKISQYGVYQGSGAVGSISSSYSSLDATISSGNTFYVYDDDSTEEAPEAQYFSSLASVFKGDRPNPGIVLTQYFPGMLIGQNTSSMRMNNLSTGSARYYPFTESRRYDYFNSAKIINSNILSKDNISQYAGVSNVNGAINNANPFVVYENSFPCNKILISVQNHVSVPDNFYVDILVGSSWQQVYNGTSATDWVNGKLEIYYNNTASWTKTVNRITNLSEISSPSTQTKLIKGIRLRVVEMSPVIATISNVSRKFRSSLELIEMSPRLEADVSAYTESFSFNSSIAEGEFGLPVGKIVSSNGNVMLSNESETFLLSGSAAAQHLLTPDVEFRFYQTVSSSNVPLKVMYSDSWDIGEDYTANVSLSDRMRIFQETNAVDLATITSKGIPFSVLILMLLDNLGITGYEFKQSDSDATNEDTLIKNFFCNREQTVAEVLENIAVATQSAMFIDAVGNLNVLTKERVCNTERINESTSTTSGGTDFWAIYDDKYTASNTEYSYINGYKPNVITAQEEKIDPVTEGTITYHSYGIRKSPGTSILEDAIPKNILDDMPANSLVGTGYNYTFSKVWSPGSDNESVLGAANLLKDISSTRVKNLYTSPIDAIDQHEAIKIMVQEATTNSAKQQSLLMYLDRNEIYTFPTMSGYVMVDSEIIEYNGIAYSVNGSAVPEVFFSREDLNNFINKSELRGSIVPIALVNYVRFRIDNSNDDGTYSYIVDGDGRAQFGTKVAAHKAFNENSTGLEKNDRFSIIIGGKPNVEAPGRFPKITVLYDFSKISGIQKIKRALKLPKENYKTYLGYLRLIGNRSPLEDRKALNAGSDNQVLSSQNKIDDKVDDLVPGSEFDPYVYTLGERFVYGQKIDLEFTPNIVGTTMRLYSARKNTKGNQTQMTTNSSIAGVGIGLDMKRQGGKTIINSGYFLEVETLGSGKDFAAKEAFKNNLRFYKLEAKDGKIKPNLLATAQVKSYTVSNLDAQVVAGENNPGDPVFDLEIRMEYANKGVEFKIYYGGRDISPKKKIQDKVPARYFKDKKNVFMFVRNDSEAIYENIYAAAKTNKAGANESIFKANVEFDELVQRGSIPQSTHYLFKNRFRLYYNDFGKIVRQVKKYEPRYNSPVLFSKLIDISRVNPQYMIKKQRYTPFGAEVVVVNTSNTAIRIVDEDDLPLWILGPQLEELSTGNITVDSIYKKIDEDGTKSTDIEFNKSVYGIKGFNIDSTYIQSIDQADKLMKWILKNCSNQRFKISLEMFPNPLIELGDKVRVFSSDRGYNMDNSIFKNSVFIVSEINRSVSEEGPSMKVTLIQVGES